MRDRPYTDESDETLVSALEFPRFLMVAFYEGDRDFVNVQFISLLGESESHAEAVRQVLFAFYFYYYFYPCLQLFLLTAT